MSDPLANDLSVLAYQSTVQVATRPQYARIRREGTFYTASCNLSKRGMMMTTQHRLDDKHSNGAGSDRAAVLDMYRA